MSDLQHNILDAELIERFIMCYEASLDFDIASLKTGLTEEQKRLILHHSTESLTAASINPLRVKPGGVFSYKKIQPKLGKKSKITFFLLSEVIE